MTRVRVHLATALGWVVFLAALVVVPRITPDEAALREWLAGLGALGPVAYVVAEAVQVVVIPIPGQPIEIPGGHLFGLVPGILLASVGAVAGSLIAFRLGRRWGRSWVEARVAPEVRARLDGWLERGHRAEWAVFWLMLVPAFPRDPLCYLAGLTRLTTAQFAVIAAVGRPAGLIPWVALGADGVALGLRLQIWLAAGAGAVWLGHTAWVRITGGAGEHAGERAGRSDAGSGAAGSMPADIDSDSDGDPDA